MNPSSTSTAPGATWPTAAPLTGSPGPESGSGPSPSAGSPEARRLPTSLEPGQVKGSGARLQTTPQLDSKATVPPTSTPKKTPIEAPRWLYSSVDDTDVAYFGSTVGAWFAVTFRDAESGSTVMAQCKTLSVNTTRTPKGLGTTRTELEFACGEPRHKLRAALGLPTDLTPSNKIRCELGRLLELTQWHFCMPTESLASAVEERPVDVVVFNREAGVGMTATMTGGSRRRPSSSVEQDVTVQLRFKSDGFPLFLDAAGFERVKSDTPGVLKARGSLDRLAADSLICISTHERYTHFRQDLEAISREKFVELLKQTHGSDGRFALQLGHWFSEGIRCARVTGESEHRPASKWPAATGVDDPLIRISARPDADEALSENLCDALSDAGFALDSDGQAWVGRVSMLPETVSVHADSRSISYDDKSSGPKALLADSKAVIDPDRLI